ncbi:MAG: hypothetical protein RL094_622 [Candidatus Parcubacteria bacterium]|jgi:N6-L-threonylcarbamoyladenine synthase
MIILSIETSCDETAIAILEANGDATSPSFRLLGNALYSQAKSHAEFGGVFPMLAKREHGINIVPLLSKALGEAKDNGLQFAPREATISQEKINEISKILERENDLAQLFLNFISTNAEIPKIDAICVTNGPGLEPALWVGISFAKALSTAWDIPVVPVNHMEGHIVSVLMSSQTDNSVQFPALALLISGGHTELLLINNWHDYTVIGQTRDDAIGEAFDKAARILGLPYPGGPEISKLAAERRASNASSTRPYELPRPMLKSPDLDFSFSGIKTAVLYLVKKLKEDALAAGTTAAHLSPEIVSAICAEFENAVTEVLVEKTRKAMEQTNAKTLILGGGVVANTFIRANFEQLIAKDFSYAQLFVPSVDMSTDNAVMIGIAGYLRYIANPQAAISSDFKAQGNLRL